MIIWLNGPFGAGKTTLADRLRLRRPDLLVFDPEEIGFVVKATVPPAASGDYQDLPLWRALTVAALVELRRHYRQDIVVPMTLVQPDYLDELLGGARRIGDELLHVFLDLDAELLRDRIERQVMAYRKFKRPFRAVCWVGGGRASPVLGTDRTSVSGFSTSRGHAAALSAAMLR
ncbi:AAA family ATPase [Pseudomonas aeruginosa]|nr:AAA family ATPase [Pseudomonas aeruginosa]